MPDTPIRLFISYAHADSAFVDRLEADLQKQGYDPWVDRQRLKGGQRWRRELQDAVKRAQVLLIVLSPDAVAAENVQIEYDYMLELGNVVIPLYYRQCEVPMELRAIQWIDFRKSYEQGFAALLEVLHRQQEQVTTRSSSPQETAHLLEDPSAAPPTTAEVDTASFQLGQQPATPAKPEPLWKVPSTFTSFVGREQEVAEISALLKQPEMRLVTLLGPGGIGKTRLSLAVATEMRSFFVDGSCFVGLAAISDPQLVMPTIAQELGLKESGTHPPFQQVQAFVGEQSLLLLLDNFEQVVAAAPEIEELLATCPNLKILVTSRAVLHLSAEQVVSVAPLALPDLAKGLNSESIAQSTAVTLFVQRARSQLPGFQVMPVNAQAIAEICVQLDGLPLAIELAAARIRLLPPQTLLSHLSQRMQVLTGGSRSAPARHRTLRNTLQWSYDLLGKEEQALFRLLTVFIGGWTLEAAEALAQGTGQANLDVLNTLSALLDNSLLQQSEQEAEEPRFRMLQTVREYGLELLEATGERETTQAVHARYFLALAEQAQPELEGPNQTVWLQRLEQEHDNLRAALEWTLEEGTDEQTSERKELALRLSPALELFWYFRGYYSEARTLLERVLASSEGQSASLHARVQQAAAFFAILMGDHKRAEVLAQQSLEFFRELNDIRGMARSLSLLALVAWAVGKPAEGLALSEERVRLIRQVGKPGEVAEALWQHGYELSTHGEYDRGQALFEEALRLFRKAGNELWAGKTLILSAIWLWVNLGDRATIHQRLQEGQALVTKVGDLMGIAQASYLTAALAWSEGEMARAASLAQEALAICRKIDYKWYIALTLQLLGWIDFFQGEVTAARHSCQESLAASQELDAKYLIALNLEVLAVLVATQGAPRWTAQLWGAAEVLREVTAIPMPPATRAIYEWAVSQARAQLGEEAFAAAWQEGRAMPLEQVIADVLKWGGEAGKQ